MNRVGVNKKSINSWRFVLFLLFLGPLAMYMGVKDLVSGEVNIPTRGRTIFELLNAVFGTSHSDDYFEIFFGICMIFAALLKAPIGKSSKRRD